jgi:hypothetical protein
LDVHALYCASVVPAGVAREVEPRRERARAFVSALMRRRASSRDAPLAWFSLDGWKSSGKPLALRARE